jgi:hypothetical protein
MASARVVQYRGMRNVVGDMPSEANTRHLVLTPDGRRKMEAELQHLTTTRRRDVAGRIHRAMASPGDPVDNPQYQDAKDEQALVEGRIRALEQMLKESVAPELLVARDAVRDGSQAHGRPHMAETATRGVERAVSGPAKASDKKGGKAQ